MDQGQQVREGILKLALNLGFLMALPGHMFHQNVQKSCRQIVYNSGQRQKDGQTEQNIT